ncbi:MAG: hypothetical protein CL920_10180 [Deltaproteobacteria bacterium]|nr:hypothetical protein [Deltaproteobacteria bacterium]|tara:strand:- start:2696 stop:3586 length:891 start_codon:yes stop_codon:yes gene_type:complete
MTSRPSKEEEKKILEKEGITEFDEDIRRFGLERLKKEFGAASSGRVIIARVIKNLIWQAVRQVRSGQMEGLDGNLRSFFYTHIKPVIARIPGALDGARDPYDTMLGAFVELVEDYRLVSYIELDLDDENYFHRLVGETHPHLIVFAEKAGFFRFLKKLHQELGVTVASLGGTPSVLSTEYLVHELSKKVELSKTFVALSITDWDPSGHQIAQAQVRQFGSFGLKEVVHKPMIHPEHYTQDEIEIFRYPLPGRQKTKNQNWLEETGGIGGELLGLESDSLPRKRLRQLIEKALSEYM